MASQHRQTAQVSATTLFRALGGAPAARLMVRAYPTTYRASALVETVCQRIQEQVADGALPAVAGEAAFGVAWALTSGHCSTGVHHHLVRVCKADVRGICALVAEVIAAMLRDSTMTRGGVTLWLNQHVRYEYGRDSEGHPFARRVS